MVRKRVTGRKPRGRGKFRSMKVSDGFKSFVLDQLDGLGDVQPKAMFGGVGLYCDGVFFGILARDTLYLKVGDRNRARFEAAGGEPFRPYGDERGSMHYYAVPLNVLESAFELVEWARGAVAEATLGKKR